jgi:hypothetical protein
MIVRSMAVSALIATLTIVALSITVKAAVLDEAAHHHCLSELRRGVPQSASCIAAGYGHSGSTPVSAPEGKKPVKK